MTDKEFIKERWLFTGREFTGSDLSYVFETPDGRKLQWGESKGNKRLCAGSFYEITYCVIGNSTSMRSDGTEAPLFIEKVNNFEEYALLDHAATVKMKAFNKAKNIRSKPGFDKMTLGDLIKMRRNIKPYDQASFDLAISDILKRGR